VLRRRIVFTLAVLLLLVAAKRRGVDPPAVWPLAPPPRDQFTFSQPLEVVTRHLALDLTVDFEHRRIGGTAQLEIENLTGTRTLILDTNGLIIERVILDKGVPATWHLGEATSFGRPLEIAIEAATRSVTVEYQTASGTASAALGDGLYWLSAGQTVGGREPWLYSNNAPIGARRWMPVQDTPAVRMTYEATLHVPPGLLALMSAANNPQSANDTGVYRFQTPYPLPSYLIALAVGRLEFRRLDERTGVYAEPELIEAAAWDLQYLPAMVDASERVAGPFPFPRHDTLLIPPGAPFVGMESPMLNFVEAYELVAGDRAAHPEPKLAAAHELAHAWAGDRTTLATWNDVWLNEGFASYLALRILDEMPDDREWLSDDVIELRWFGDRLQCQELVEAVEPGTTILHRSVADPNFIDPIMGFHPLSYFKGEMFLRTLEDRLGRERFDAFLERYFQLFAWRWTDDRSFLAALRELVVAGDPALEQQLRLDEWLYEPGLPSNLTAPAESVLQTRVKERGGAFKAGTPVTELSVQTWTGVETLLFLDEVNANGSLGPRMAAVDAALGLSTRDTPPLVWLEQSIRWRYEPGVAAAERVLLRGAPFTWIPALYRDLVLIDRPRALSIFTQARDHYLRPIAEQVARELGEPAQRAAWRNAA
jgi:leukotriene-A4 hydrolase